MKAFIFGKFTIGDKLIVEHLKRGVGSCEYLGAKVDLSKIVPEDENLIVISNPSLFHIDLDRVVGYINKDVSKPLMVLKKTHTFGAVFFEPNFKVEKITTNKLYNFAGLMFLPEKYFKALPKDRKTIAEIFRTVPYEDWSFFIVDNRKK